MHKAFYQERGNGEPSARLPARAGQARLEPCTLLEQVLQHGRGIGGPGLPALDGALKVLDASAALPDLFELPGQDLSPALPSQTRLLEIQLAHLHVILACRQETSQNYHLSAQHFPACYSGSTQQFSQLSEPITVSLRCESY